MYFAFCFRFCFDFLEGGAASLFPLYFPCSFVEHNYVGLGTMKSRFLELTTKTLNVRINKNNDVNLRFIPRTLTNKDVGVQNGQNTFFCGMSDAVVCNNPSAFMHFTLGLA